MNSGYIWPKISLALIEKHIMTTEIDYCSTYPRYDHNGYQNDRYADSRDDY